jgi:cell division septum initiation protein DivIVA
MELLELAKKEYEELNAKKKELKNKLKELEKKGKALTLFLRSSGELPTSGKRRGRKPKNATMAE